MPTLHIIPWVSPCLHTRETCAGIAGCLVPCWQQKSAIPDAGGKHPTEYTYSAYLALSRIHPPTLIASSIFSAGSHSLASCFSNISYAPSQSAGCSLKVSLIYIREFPSVSQPEHLTLTWSRFTLCNPLFPHPSLLPDLSSLLLLIFPSSSSPVRELHPHSWKISNTPF